jgi:glucose/arabinose dehydrogenase
VVKRTSVLLVALAAVSLLAGRALAGPPPPNEEDRYYRIVPIPVPAPIVLEAVALEEVEPGRLAVGTRFGEIYLLDGAFDLPLGKPRFQLYAGGLHEVLGLARRGEWLYAVQKGEVTRLKDLDGDRRADLFETVSDGWEISGDYHEYAFGSKFDREGNLWVALCLTGSFSSNALFRGWALKVSETGVLTPVASGLRSPGGIGENAEGDMFYTDNQGPWNGACYLREVKPGSFMGHPAGNRWYPEAPGMGPAPPEPVSGSRIHLQMARIPQLMPPAVVFPYAKMGQSASGIACDRSSGRFGPFTKQLFVGDQTQSIIMRVFLEKVKGHYQGACFPFRKGFQSGNLSVLQAGEGSLFTGGTDRGWGSRGGKQFALERLVWTGQVPFEILEMRVRPDGFLLTFTRPVDAATAADPASYRMETYTYIYQAEYGSPEVDRTEPVIEKAEVSSDGRSVLLRVRGLEIGHVHELHLPGLRSADNHPLLHPVAYYTLYFMPDPA